MKDTKEYGTVECYEELFADILADIGTSDLAANEATAENMLIGFERAIESWAFYHLTAADSYKKLLSRFREAERHV